MALGSAAGWALILAVIIGWVASLLTPGGLLIDLVDAASFREAAGVLRDNASLAQVLTLLFVISVVLYWFGLNSLHRAFSGRSVVDRVSRFALNIFLVGYAFLIVELSVRHILTHMLAHGVGGTDAEHQAMATTLFMAAAGIHIAFLYVTSIGSTIFGLALACRCEGMSIFKLGALGLGLTGLLSVVVLMIAGHVTAIDLHGVAVASNGVLFFGSLCIVVIGVGIMQGRREFVGEEAAA